VAKPVEKRVIVENCFSNRTVVGKTVCLEPYDWLEVGKKRPPVLYGAHYRDTNRTFDMPKELDRLLQMMRVESLDDLDEAA
jgi:hypothetical protein